MGRKDDIRLRRMVTHSIDVIIWGVVWLLIIIFGFLLFSWFVWFQTQ